MNSHIEIYGCFVWATWNREPFIMLDWERDLWRELRSEVVAQNCRLLALDGTRDHVHLLVEFRATLTVADCVQQVKGASSLWANDRISRATYFSSSRSQSEASSDRAPAFT